MDLSYYDINPGILGLIIWGLISYFMRGKKKQKNNLVEKIYVLSFFLQKLFKKKSKNIC